MHPNARYYTLDAMRGLAAIIVLFYHAGEWAPVPLPGGYLAVDLFFLLSGFVISLIYAERLRSGMSPGAFMVNRLIRVYPMILVGLWIGSLYVAPQPQNFALLPVADWPAELFPVNVPMWSLFVELLVNLGFACFALRIGRRGAIAILLASGAIMLWGATTSPLHLDQGNRWDGALVGMARGVFSFTVGAIIHHLRREHLTDRRKDWRALLLLPALIGVLAIDVPVMRGVWDVFCVAVCLPAILWLGTKWETPGSPVAAALGDMSFPLYCIHSQIIWRTGSDFWPVFLSLLAIAWLLDRFMDRPVRRFLTLLAKRLQARPATA